MSSETDALQPPPPAATRTGHLRILAGLPIPLFLLCMAGLWIADLRSTFESRFLVLVLNFFCSTVAAVFIAYLAGRSFLVRRTPGLLLLGCGVIAWGAAGQVEGVLRILGFGGQIDVNVRITIHNLCAWLSALCHLLGTVCLLRSKLEMRAPRAWLAAAYTLILGIVGLLTLSALAQWTAPFFVQGQGGTPARLFMLGSTIAMFVLSAALLGAMSRGPLSSFVHWYTLALSLIAVGLFGVMIESVAFSLLSWTGIAAQCLSGVYMLIAAIALVREPGARGLMLEPTRSLARYYRYGVAIILAAVAAAVRLAFLQSLGMAAPFLTFYPAIMLAALYGGARAGVLATVLSAAFAAYFWMEPVGHFAVNDPVDWIGTTFFLVSCVMISWIAGAMQRAQARAQQAEAQVQLAAERKQTEAAANKYHLISQHARDPLILLERSGKIVEANQAAVELYGYSREALLELNIKDLRRGDVSATVECQMQEASAKGILFETLHTCKDGSSVPVEVSSRGVTIEGRQMLLSVVRNITERKQAEERFRVMANAMPQLAWIAQADGYIFWYNQRWYDYTGTTPEQMKGWGWQSVHDEIELPKVLDLWKASIATGEPFEMTFPLRGADGIFRPFLTRGHPLQDEEGRVLQWFGTNTDVTEQLRAQRERETTIEFLRLVNESAGTNDLIRAAVTFFQQQSGCEAVGIRLKEGDDHPYFEARGFPREFVSAENSLCRRDAEGKVMRDSVGDPICECMCGNVICGRFDPSKPFFTTHGSFYSNCTTDLLATTTEADRQIRTRNRCNGEGYESVALLPLRVGGQRLGLIQLNDRRKGLFSAETIALWERLADYLAVALGKSRAEEALRQSEQRLALAASGTRIGMFDWNMATNEVISSEQHAQLLGLRTTSTTTTLTQSYHYHDWAERVHPEDMSRVEATIRQCLAEGRVFEVEYRVVWPDGSVHWLAIRGVFQQDTPDSPRRMLGIAMDITERKRAEEALRESEERLRLALEASATGTFEIDLETGEGHWNATEYELLGLKPGDIPSNPEAFFHCVHPDDVGMLRSKWEEAVRIGNFDAEFRIMRADGEMRWLAGRGRFAFAGQKEEGDTADGRGQALRFMGVNFDITEAKRAEDKARQLHEAVAREKERLSALVNSISDEIWFANTDGKFTLVNPAASREFDLGADEVIVVKKLAGSLEVRCSDGSLRPLEEAPPLRALRGEVVRNQEEIVRTPIGDELRYRQVSSSPVKDHAGNIIGAVSVVHDITELKQAEEELREVSLRLSYHVDHSPLAVIEWGPDMRLIRWSDVAEKVFGWKAEEVLGKRMEDFRWIYQDDEPQVADVSAELQIGANPRRFSANRNYRKDGSVVHCEWYNSSLLDESGKLRSILSLVLDVTERKRAERALQEATSQLKTYAEDLEKTVALRTAELCKQTAEREQLQKELLNISEREKQLISQELHDGLCQNLAGTALMSRMLYTRLTAREDPDAKYAKEIYDLLGTGVNEARNLSHGLHPVGPQGEGLMNALSQLAGTVHNLFHIDCIFDCPEPVFLENETVSTHLYRITQEAINNARKHGEADRVTIRLLETPEGLTLTIEDNGVGIPAKMPKKAGMGLRIMNRRASEIGATISVCRADENGGTVVTCTLPHDSKRLRQGGSQNSSAQG